MQYARITTSKMRKYFVVFRILDVVIFALSHLALSYFRPTLCCTLTLIALWFQPQCFRKHRLAVCSSPATMNGFL